MPHDISPVKNIGEIPYEKYRVIALCITDSWRDVLARAGECTRHADGRYQLQDWEIKQIEQTPLEKDGPGGALLKKLGNRGMTVAELIGILDQLKMEKPLLLLKDPDPLEIVEKPPSSVMVKEGGLIQLKCSARGFPFPWYTWFKERTEVSPSNSNGLLEIPSAKLTDAGMYTCRVHNNRTPRDVLWSNDMGWCQVEVKPKPIQPLNRDTHPLHILKHPTNQQNQRGGACIFDIDVKGTGQITYQWYHNGDPVPGASQRELILKKLTLGDKGKYMCHVTCQGDNGQEISKMSHAAELKVTLSDEVYTATDKVALLLFVSTYRGIKTKDLKDVKHDLIETRTTLEKMNFKVISFLDLTLQEMRIALHMFKSLVDKGVYAVLYVAGHGFTCEGRQFLVPWDSPDVIIPAESFCIEEAQTEIQQKNPALFLIILEMCLIDRDRVNTANFTMPPVPPTKGNFVKMSAAGSQQSAYGEPANITNRSPRGLFNKYLTKAMDKKLTFFDLFKEVKAGLQECSYDLRIRFPMNPTIYTDIEEQGRSLVDPIICKGPDQEKRAAACKEIITKISGVPQDIKEDFISQTKEVLGQISLEFEQYSSNLLAMHSSFLARPGVPVVQCIIDVIEDDWLTNIKPVISYQTTASVRTFQIANLQRLRGRLRLKLRVQLLCKGQAGRMEQVYEQDLATPLISSKQNYWQNSLDKLLKVDAVNKERVPTEHEAKLSESE